MVNRILEVWRIEQGGDIVARVGEREEHVIEGLRPGSIDMVPESISGGSLLTVELGPGTWGIEVNYGTLALPRYPLRTLFDLSEQLLGLEIVE